MIHITVHSLDFETRETRTRCFVGLSELCRLDGLLAKINLGDADYMKSFDSDSDSFFQVVYMYSQCGCLLPHAGAVWESRPQVNTLCGSLVLSFILITHCHAVQIK